MITPFKYLALAFSMMVMVACSSNPPVNEFGATADPAQEIKNLESNINKSYSEQANVLSPKNFHQAQTYLGDAKDAQSNNKSNKKILDYVALGNAWLSKANSSVSTANGAIPDVVQARARALEAKAEKFNQGELQKTDKDLIDIGDDFDAGKTGVDLKERAKLLDQYMSVELNSIKNDKLGEARGDIKAAIAEGAEKITPQTLSSAKMKLNNADAYITANRQNTAEVNRISNDAKQEASRAWRITRQAKIDKNKSPEQIALEMEKEKNQTNSLSGEVAGLQGGAALEQKFAAAQSKFDSSEAEVYKQGDKILIRLKGLNFPSGQAVLTPATYPLMAKVQSALKDMGDSKITISGHTDSIGSKKVNLKLSQERAASVKEYLVQNGNVAENNIDSNGYGDQKPLASNKTKEGRAENRRVDIVVNPITEGQTK